jgi:predicted RNA-binding protein with PUA-like domain
MTYWLLKSEPNVFSWSDQLSRGAHGEPWTGVRNHSAKLNLLSMKTGDLAFFYHSNIGKEIVGIVAVIREAYPDPTATDGPWVCVDVRAVRPLSKSLSLQQIRQDEQLNDMTLLRQSRLSVQPVTTAQWRRVCDLSGTSPDAD